MERKPEVSPIDLQSSAAAWLPLSTAGRRVQSLNPTHEGKREVSAGLRTALFKQGGTSK